MIIIKIKLKNNDYEMITWLKNVLPDMCECEIFKEEYV
jgi:hypothetical protein